MLQPNVDLSGIQFVYFFPASPAVYINILLMRVCMCVTVMNTRTSSNIKLPKGRRKNLRG